MEKPKSWAVWMVHMPRLLVKELEKATQSYKAMTGVVCDGFHPKVPWI